jgi:hypothetical protein
MTENSPEKRNTIYIEVRKNPNESLYSMDTLVDTEIAVLSALQQDGRLSPSDFKRLESLVKMKESIMGMKNEQKKESLLEGLTQEEIKEMAQTALNTLKEK